MWRSTRHSAEPRNGEWVKDPTKFMRRSEPFADVLRRTTDLAPTPPQEVAFGGGAESPDNKLMRSLDVQVSDANDVFVQMTLTFPGCGMGPHIAQQAEWAIQDVEGVEEVNIELTFDPPWSPDLISEEARNMLGI